MKIAVLYIGLGRYSVFWKNFYESSENFFLKNHQKTYFMFTDNQDIIYQDKSNVRKIHQDSLKFPLGSLMRFEMFKKVEKELEEYDYIFFFNANMQFVDFVNEECLPSDDNDGLVMGLHPGFYNMNPDKYSYERNPASTAYIPYGTGKYYFQGCLNGGKSKQYLELINTLDVEVKRDLEKDIIAIWWDESHLNKYMLDKNPLILPPNYLYPEGWKLKEYRKNKKIIQVDKADPKWGGLDYLRGLTDEKVPVNRIFSMLIKPKNIFV